MITISPQSTCVIRPIMFLNFSPYSTSRCREKAMKRKSVHCLSNKSKQENLYQSHVRISKPTFWTRYATSRRLYSEAPYRYNSASIRRGQQKGMWQGDKWYWKGTTLSSNHSSSRKFGHRDYRWVCSIHGRLKL